MTQINSPSQSVTDPDRLAALDALAVLDTPAEKGFDDAVRLATRLCAAPVALVSLVATDRQWFKARVGFPHCETALDRSVCKFALVEADLLVIPDLTADARTAANPLVTGEPHIRFYAGAPLRLSDGQVVGSLCVIDTVPRPEGLTPEQADDLRALGRQVSSLLEMRRAVVRRDQALDDQRVELRQARRLELLSQASAALLGAPDAAAVLEPILATGTDTLGFDLCFIYDVDPGGRNLRLVQSVGADEDTRAALSCIDRDVPLCGLVVQTRRPLVLAAVQSSTEPRHDIARRAGVDAFASYPITSRGQVVGVVSFASTHEPMFEPEALVFFSTVARLMSGVRERSDIDAALRASDRRSRLAQEAGGVGTFEVDVTSGSISVSPEFATIFGVPVTSLYSAERFEALVVPEDRALMSDERTRQAGTAALDTEYRIHRANDDEIRWIARRATFVRDETGAVVQMFGTVRDVTEQRRVQDDLARAGERLRLAVDATSIGIFDYDLVTGELSWDERVRKLFGVAPDASVTCGGSFLPSLHPDDRAAADAAVQEAIDPAGSGMFDTEYRVLPLDGGPERWIAARGQAVMAEGRTKRFVGTVRDVTESRQAAEGLRVAEERLNLAFEASRSLGWWDWDIPNDRLYAGENFARMYGVDPAAAAAGAPIAGFIEGIHPDDRGWVGERIQTAIATAGEFAEEYRLQAPDGTVTWVFARGRCYHDERGRPVRYPGVAVDVTATKQASLRQAALLGLGDRLRDLDTMSAIVHAGAEVMAQTLGAERAGYGVIDPDRMMMDIPADWCAPGVSSIAGRHDLRAFGAYAEEMKRGEVVVVDDVEVNPRDPEAANVLLSLDVRMMINVPIMERRRLTGAGFVHYSKLHPLTADDLAFVRTVVDRIQIALARVRADEQQALLNGELSHRLKNTLSMVQGIAVQALRDVPDQAPVQAFTQRLIALSQAHDVLLQDSWATAPFRAVVEQVLALQAPLERFRIEGPNLALAPQATLSLSLLLHELTTNAVKYGALSNEAGTVSVAWRVENDGERTVVLSWEERGGPPAQAPSRRGFGTRLIRIGLVGTRDTQLSYTPLGFRAQFRAPSAQVVAA